MQNTLKNVKRWLLSKEVWCMLYSMHITSSKLFVIGLTTFCNLKLKTT